MKLLIALLLAVTACAQTAPVSLPKPPPPVAAAIPKAADDAKGVNYSSLTVITGLNGVTHGYVLPRTPAPNTRIKITRRLNGIAINFDSVAAPPDTQPTLNRRTVRLNMPDLVGAPANSPDTFDFEYETLE